MPFFIEFDTVSWTLTTISIIFFIDLKSFLLSLFCIADCYISIHHILWSAIGLVDPTVAPLVFIIYSVVIQQSCYVIICLFGRMFTVTGQCMCLCMFMCYICKFIPHQKRCDFIFKLFPYVRLLIYIYISQTVSLTLKFFLVQPHALIPYYSGIGQAKL